MRADSSQMKRCLIWDVSAHAAAFGLKVNWVAAVVPAMGTTGL